MKIFIFTLMTFISAKAFAVCSTPISRTNVGTGAVLTSTKYNSDVNIAYNRINNLPGDCVANASIATVKLANGAITTAKIADGAVTAAKLAAGAVPEAGRLLRVSTFTSSGTWTKQSDVGSVMVQVVGGGGASYYSGSTAGGASSFGTHCTANGGGVPADSSSAGGAGGTATGGDINLTGGQGEQTVGGTYPYGGAGGRSMIGHYGRGGMGSNTAVSSGGGAGGFCAKLLDDSSLSATETVTIGAGGTNSGSFTTPGMAGIVLVYEYSK